MARRGSYRSPTRNYERFKQYLHIMHNEALNIMHSLDTTDQQYVSRFFSNFYPTQKEHYWSLKKLFCLAMYTPMFLQIGLSHKNKLNKSFDALIYVDTHAGPGLAKVGNDDKDIVLGSPLIAIRWPEIIATNVKSFSKIYNGFDKLFFVEKDKETFYVLKRTLKSIRKDIEVIKGDTNNKLMIIKKQIERECKNPLILMFIDPFGKIETQIEHNKFKDFIEGWSVDLVFNVMSSSIVRGLTSLKENGADIKKIRDVITYLWGDLCESNLSSELRICDFYKNPQKHSIGIEDVVDAYKHRLRLDGYKFVEAIPVKYKGNVLYHLIFASKAKNSYKWLGNYIEYIKTKVPEDYETLKNLWMLAKGRQKQLFE